MLLVTLNLLFTSTCVNISRMVMHYTTGPGKGENGLRAKICMFPHDNETCCTKNMRLLCLINAIKNLWNQEIVLECCRTIDDSVPGRLGSVVFHYLPHCLFSVSIFFTIALYHIEMYFVLFIPVLMDNFWGWFLLECSITEQDLVTTLKGILLLKSILCHNLNKPMWLQLAGSHL